MATTKITPLKLKPAEREALDRLAEHYKATRTETVRTLIADKIAEHVCHWCGRKAIDGYKIVTDSDYVGGVGYVNEYRCEPDCRSGGGDA